MASNLTARHPRGRVTSRGRVWILAVGLCACVTLTGAAQGAKPSLSAPRGAAAGAAAQPAPPAVAADYVIGPTDVLSIVFWGDRDLSTEVTVRPDGKISLPLLNDIVAAGLTPEQLRSRLTDAARRFVQSPVVTVVVRQVNNNRAFITGQISNPGPYVLSGPTTVLQLIAMAGGFTDYADRKHVLITRIENGVQRAFSFNYDNVVKQRDLTQNLILKAGDTVVVP
jgi:polysaccharide export outer membrane protein